MQIIRILERTESISIEQAQERVAETDQIINRLIGEMMHNQNCFDGRVKGFFQAIHKKYIEQFTPQSARDTKIDFVSFLITSIQEYSHIFTISNFDKKVQDADIQFEEQANSSSIIRISKRAFQALELYEQHFVRAQEQEPIQECRCLTYLSDRINSSCLLFTAQLTGLCMLISGVVALAVYVGTQDQGLDQTIEGDLGL